MTFSSNKQPKKVKKPAGKPWICKCGSAMPGYIIFCSRCNTLRPAG